VPERVARNLVTTVELHDGRTLATRVGAWPEWLLAALGMGAVGAAALTGRRRRDGASERGLEP
jgi:apolipoprotein N-acyltransferase